MELPDKETFTDTGLDWSIEDRFTSQERLALLDWYRQAHGTGDLRLVPFAEFLIDFLPAEFKLSRRHLRTIPQEREGVGLPDIALILAYLHSYVATAYTDGILYQVISARRLGASKALILDVLRYAYLNAGPRGMNAVARTSEQYLRDWSDDDAAEPQITWPDGWKPNPEAFASGIDQGTTALSADEVGMLVAWHERMTGSRPVHVELLARLHPEAFKLQRIRYERAIGSILPAQLIPLLTLHLAIMRLDHSSVRQATHQAMVLGVERHHVVQMVFCGLRQSIDPMVTESVVAALAPILDDWAPDSV